jgi:hypothetical protein
VLERMLTALGKPVWEANPEDVDRVLGAMAAKGVGAPSRRNYAQPDRYGPQVGTRSQGIRPLNSVYRYEWDYPR